MSKLPATDSPSRLDHWEAMAETYDAAKEKNAYYYETLFRLCRRLIPDVANQQVLDIGCGTGSILARLNPRQGLGIDMSAEMIRRAAAKYAARPQLEFRVLRAEDLGALNRTFQAVIMCDVLEHVDDVGACLRAPLPVIAPGGVLLVSTSSPLWAFPLWVLEKTGRKMPEGPHVWVSLRRIVAEMQRCGYRVLDAGYQTLLPAPVPVLARFANDVLARFKPFQRLALTEYVLARRAA